MEPKDKVALITGGTRMGGAIAEALAARGVRVVLGYRKSREAVEEFVTRIRSAGGEASMVAGDVTDPEQVKKIAEEAAGVFGRLDILLNMASSYAKHSLEELDAAAWDRSMNVDARGAYLMSLAVAPQMKKHGAGRIINFSDWLPRSGRPRYRDFVTYYAAKSAVIGLTESLALEMAPDILVNAIAPGPILAPPDMSEEEKKSVERSTPLGRWGGAGEIAKAALFLIETDFVTGECIRVDGGRHLN